MGILLPTLFSQKPGSKKVIQWQIWVHDNHVVRQWGQLGGTLQRKSYLAKGKNIGKVNETTPYEQADLEAQALWIKQVNREDYATTPEASNKQTRPMLAHDFLKVPHRVDWSDACTQPKLDGLRLIYGPRWPGGEERLMLSRKGDTYNLPHLDNELKVLWTQIEGSLPEGTRLDGIDGEIYLHGMPLQQIVKRAKKYRAHTAALEFHVFDILVSNTPFADRYDFLTDGYYGAEAFDKIRLVPTYYGLVDEEGLHDAHGQYVQRGYEGAMIRHLNGNYKAGRSADLFKYKQFMDEECLIIAVYPDKNNNAMLTVVRGNGVHVQVTPKRTHDERKYMLNNSDRYINKHITVKYFAETDDGSLQFPIGMGIREVSNGQPVS